MVHRTILRDAATSYSVDMVIWDTSGELSELQRLRSVHNVDCIVLCMTVDSPDSIADIEEIVSLGVHKLATVS